jgi:hypothetical protein
MRREFWADETGSGIEYVAVGALFLAAAALFMGYCAQQWASDGDLPSIAFLSSDQYVAKKFNPPSFNSIDYSATGSSSSRQTVILDPCTGRAKSE